jgi:hypothetical protein
MSWRFSKFPIKATRIPDSEDTNDNFLEIVEEIGGELNEHNWQDKGDAATAIARTDIDRDDVFLWHSVGDQRAAGFPAESRLLGGNPFVSDNAVEISSASSWVGLTTTRATFTSPNTLLWIHASVQAIQTADWMTSIQPTGAWRLRTDDSFSNLSVGIGVDGVVIPESVVGGAEPDNDRNYGLMAPSMAVATSLVLPITAGQHTISIMVRVGPKTGNMIGGQAAAPREGVANGASGVDLRDKLEDWGGRSIQFAQREIIVLEMRR